MAWPKPKKRKPPATLGNRDGVAPDGTQSDAAAPDGTQSDAAAPGGTQPDATASDSAARERIAHGGAANGVTANGSPAANGSPGSDASRAANGGPAANGDAANGSPANGSPASDASPAANGGPAANGDAENGSPANGSTAAYGAPPQGAPLPWPGASGAAEPGPADAPEDPADVPFWDWAPSGESVQPDSAAEEFQDGPGDKAAARMRSGRLSEPVVTPVVTADEEPQREGIGQHLGNLAHLSANPRMRTWQWRAIMAIVVGVGFTIWISWRLGLTMAVLAAIADTIYRSRASYARPGEAQMTRAQRRTRRQLARLERAGYHAMHLRHIPGSEDQIDHLVVGPAGVFSIDSEAWDRRIPVRTSSHRQLWHGSVSQKERLEYSRWKSERVAELISRALGSPVSVRPAMAVYGPKIPWVVANIRDVDIFSGPRLRKYLRRQARQARRKGGKGEKGNKGEGPLSASEIERIDKAAHVAFPDPAG
jgi:Nuclease-related domain